MRGLPVPTPGRQRSAAAAAISLELLVTSYESLDAARFKFYLVVTVASGADSESDSEGWHLPTGKVRPSDDDRPGHRALSHGPGATDQAQLQVQQSQPGCERHQVQQAATALAYVS
jgi:hypothetical protein